MSIANWNPTAFYLLGDEVYDGSADYYTALANNRNDPPPSANWALIPAPAGGINTITTTNGSGIDAVVLFPNAQLSTNLVAGSGISLTPSGLNTSITIGATGVVPISHGGFISTITQVLADAAGVGAGVPLFMVYDTTTSAIGCALVLGTGGGLSAIQVVNTGVYQITFSVQWDKFGGGGTNNVQMWFAVNGTPVPFSNSEIDITQQINQISCVDIILSLNAGDKVEIVGYTPVGANHVQALANPIDPTHPVAIPSIITNITRIA